MNWDSLSLRPDRDVGVTLCLRDAVQIMETTVAKEGVHTAG